MTRKIWAIGGTILTILVVGIVLYKCYGGSGQLPPEIVKRADSLRVTAPVSDSGRKETRISVDTLTTSARNARNVARSIQGRYAVSRPPIDPSTASHSGDTLYRVLWAYEKTRADSLAIGLDSALAASSRDSLAIVRLSSQVTADSSRLRAYAHTLDALQNAAEKVSKRRWWERCGVVLGAGVTYASRGFVAGPSATAGCRVWP